MMRGTLSGLCWFGRLWAGCAALVLSLHAGGAWSQNTYEVGKDYKASIPIYSADFQKVLYTIPIPAGDWRLISHELLRTSGGNQMQTLMLVAIDRQKVHAYLSMRVYAEENPTRRWNDEPCKADAIYKNDHGKRLWEQQCLRINRQAYLPNADTTFRKQSIEYLNRNKITWDTGPIVMTYGQFGDQGKLMFVEYGVFPENFGFANPRVPTAVQSPWHFTVATAEPDRKAFIDALVRYAEDYSKLLERAYKKESVQESPPLFAFNNPNPVTRVAQAARSAESGANSSRVEAELRARLEQEARARAEAEAKIKAEVEARVAAESKARAESEARERLARQQKDREGQESARLTAEKARIEADARTRAEAELRERLAREQKERAEQDGARLAQEKARIEADARTRAEGVARERQAQAQRDREARDRETRENERLAALAAENAKLRQQLAMASASAPGIRKALVIGNDGYRYVPKLQNAIEDAKALAEGLAKVGYSVTLKTDLSEKDMKSALRVFKGQVNPGDEVAIFYAGHGVQLGAANYLLPVDVGGDSEEQVRDEAIPLQRILDDMSEKKAKFTLAMLDACRDNPFKSQGRSIGGNTRGLAPTSAATGQMVVFSAGTGQQALDRLGPADKNRNGLFTRVFLREMQKPGVSVDKIVRNVRTEVVNLAKTIGHDQVPAIYDQVVGDFFFLR